MGDNFAEREEDRLRRQLRSGCYLRIYHFGESPAFAYSPAAPTSASRVRHQVAQSLVDEGLVEIVEKGDVFDVYAMRLGKAA